MSWISDWLKGKPTRETAIIDAALGMALPDKSATISRLRIDVARLREALDGIETSPQTNAVLQAFAYVQQDVTDLVAK